MVSSHSVSMYTGSQLTLRMVVNGTLFGLALLMATARILIRLHSQRKLHPEDFVLMFACSTFIASQVVFYILNIDNIYWQGALNFDPNSQILTSIIEDPDAFLRRDLKAQRMQFSIVVLTWTSIFASQNLLSALLPSNDYTTSKIGTSLENDIWNHYKLLALLHMCNFHQLSQL